MGSSAKAVTIPLIHRELGILPPEQEPRVLEIYNPRYCACCDKETMISIQRIPARGPPKSSYLPKNPYFLNPKMVGIAWLPKAWDSCVQATKKPFQTKADCLPELQKGLKTNKRITF